MRRLLSLCLAATATAVGCGPVRAHQLLMPEPVAKRVSLPFRTTEYRLPNGLSVILDEDHASPFVAVCVAYRAGSRDDSPNRSGLAHLVEHAMFEGSAHVAPREHWRRLVDASASSINAVTSPDRTIYVETVPPNALDLTLWLESDRMATGTTRLDDASLATVRHIVAEERALRLDLGLLQPVEAAALFPLGHPYHQSAVGTPADLERITLSDIRAFRARYYGPENATVVLVGDFDASKARAAIATWFGSLPKSGAHPDAYARVPPRPLLPAAHPEVHLDVRADAPAGFEVSWVVPPRLSEREGAVDVALAKLRNDTGWNLRHDAALVTSHRFSGDLAGIASIRVGERPGLTLEKFLHALDRSIHNIYGWDEAAVDFGNLLAVGQVFDFESFADRATSYARVSQIAGSAQALVHAFDTRAVDGDDAFDAGRKYFDTSSRVVLRIEYDSTAPASGRVVGSW